MGLLCHGQDEQGWGTGKVVAMDRFRSGKGLSPIRQAEAYWNALRRDGDVPYRTQIDPRGLANVLEYAFVLERVAPQLARFRLAGQHLTGLAGMEVRGMPLSAFFTPAARERIGTLLERVFDTPAVAELTLISETCRGRVQTEARMILLPLKNDLGDVSRALGLLIAEGANSAAPWRFDLTGKALRAVVPAQRDPGPVAVAEPGFAEAQSPLAGKLPHLRVVK